MSDFMSRSNQPALLALIMGALIGIFPFFVALTPETAFIAHLLGVLTVAIAIKRVLRPGRLDWAAFVGLGGIVALAPFVPIELPASGMMWVKVAAGVIIASAGIWHYLSAPDTEAGSKAADTRERPAQHT